MPITTLRPSDREANSVNAERPVNLGAYVQTVAASTIGGALLDRKMVLRGFRARMMETGTAGTGTVQLHRNGALVTGASLSFVGGTDPDGTIRSVGLSVACSPDDVLEFVVSAAGTGQTDLACAAILVEDYE